ncbi:uncharacterized protein J8A68_003652 [[Candida] subhashii]|uniref:Erythromycin biosynthesis protein CIII-like C-terminal domain-containing protein n=1 Tax=[Candida] subhashii TaxID=561895 RepID=A0A8J5QLS6_9ASCO|nr:uncharacterized protein J8A68_003652 [[Candida] subhashii]KAG7662798.1 hypothetical protein J8A68_003652 [[Candida] subhashii]
MQQSKVPFLYNVSPSVLPPAVDFPDWTKVTGYWFLDEGSDDFKPPTELVEFMDKARCDGKKIVYIGFGSIVVKNATILTQAIVEAVLKADVRCILNKGWSDRLDHKQDKQPEIELPPEIYNAGLIPHDWLFPRVDAAIHHGGSGTTGASLRAGCPTIIKPFFGDQFFYATRIEDLGVGIALKKLTGKSLSNAILKVTSDQTMIEKVCRVGQRINKDYGVYSAIEAILRLNLIRSLNHEYFLLVLVNVRKHNPEYANARSSMRNSMDIELDEVEEQYEVSDNKQYSKVSIEKQGETFSDGFRSSEDGYVYMAV